MIKKYIPVVSTIVLLCFVTSESAIDGTDANLVPEVKNASTTERTGRMLNKECSSLLSSKCLKIHMLSFIEDLSSRDELPLLPGLSIVKENQTSSPSPDEMAAELSRQFPGKPEEKLNRFLLFRLQDYLDGHSLKYRLLDPQTTQDAMEMAKGDKESIGRKSGGGGGGGLGGGKGGGGALLAAALMMKGTLAAAALGALALLAGKALMTALMSLLLSALVGLKGHGGHKSTTYEIITKPEVSHHHSHSHEEHHEHDHGHHGGYRRAYDENYNSYMPYDTTSMKLNTTLHEKSDNYTSTTEADSEKLELLINRAIDNFFKSHLIKLNALGNDIAVPREDGTSNDGNDGNDVIQRDDVQYDVLHVVKGGQDFGGGGYDANAQWQSRSIFEKLESKSKEPIITYVIPAVRYVNKDKKLTIDEVRSNNDYGKPKRRKRAAGNDLKSYNRKNLKTNVGEYEGTTKITNNNDSISNITNKTFVNNSTKLCGILSELYKQYLLANTKSKEINIAFNNKEIYINNTRLQAITIKENKRLTKDNGAVSKKTMSRSKRGILDILQNSYVYWMKKLLGIGNNRRAHTNPKYKIVNGLKYVYYPIRPVLKPKAPKENQTSRIKAVNEGFKPIVAAEDFNKGEILEAAESRMNRKKFNKMKNTVNDTMDDNPWE
ncbi:hypothetical protein K1T71_013637 [Dendrolimus kikuchii]|uniref:Uncharacterized protein n=1 Tax=Dendrolimus kikuchii TaxID=765133 RepID=A0ACC1CH16_9NEOP|nr:hypothetical protein K1T71_013637 [Dendrolimus kikuchii]